MAKKGNLSINSENMLPIIKKWLYSDHDIFVREQIANANDAITKLKKLEGIGEYKREDDKPYRIDVTTNADEKTLTFKDNGIGMTEDEVVEYITQIAFSGATAFLEKYKGKSDEDQIIGHFGLGFYSAFMVADEVHIETLSYLDGAKPVHWESDGTSEYTIDDGEREENGTTITLFLNDDNLEFCNEFRVREVLKKYCSFMPVEIYLNGEETPVNDTKPLWAKMPSECTDEEYKAFYRKVFNDFKEPLFWIHLNTDYPFNLKGILYFPRVNTEYDALEAEIKLYNNQVFIADNIKEVIPEFLMALKGVIDCPDLPLNVSRSALQNDGFVKKISEYITRKVADKLTGMCKTEREEYEKCWDNINPFIKFGCIRDEKFAEKMLEYVLFKDLNGNYLTVSEYKEKNNIPDDEEPEEISEEPAPEASDDEAATENKEDEIEVSTVYYVTDEVKQAQYIAMFKSAKKDAIILRHAIDQPFIQQLENKNRHLRFARIDATLDADMAKKKAVKKKDAELLSETFKEALGKDTLTVEAKNIKDKNIAAILTLPEEGRRMADMMKMYGVDDAGFGAAENLIVNADHPLVKYILENPKSENVPLMCKQLYDLAALSHRTLSPEEMNAFLARSNEIMLLLTK